MTSLRRRLSLCVVALLASVGIAPALAAPVRASTVQEVLEAQILAQLNDERAARGVGPLRVDNGLENASLAWSSTMSARSSLEHSSDGRAEIIASGWWTGQISQAWMQSPSHRHLIVDPNLTTAGVGVVCDQDGQLWATVQFRRADTSLGTLSASNASPVVTNGSSGSDCRDSVAIAQARRLYLAYFSRESDVGGLGYWVGQLSGDTSLAQVSEAFARSLEFRTLYGSVSNREFVRLVYRNVMNREPDAAGLNHWVRQLERGASRGAIMIGFSESSEFRSRSGVR